MRSLQAAVLVRADDPVFPTLEVALVNNRLKVEVASLLDSGIPSWRGLGVKTFARLVEYRPDLVIAEAFGPTSVAAGLYRTLAPRSRLLLCAAQRPRRVGLLSHRVAYQADLIVADWDDMEGALDTLDFPGNVLCRFPVPSDIDLFMNTTRPPGIRCRLLYTGDLSPETGAADVLICAAALAEQHPAAAVEIWWAGEGHLSGVLEAQLLPKNMSQSFLGRLDRGALASIFPQCTLLIHPPLQSGRVPLLAEALAAGLVVLGNSRSAPLSRLEREGLGCWTFDPLQAQTMVDALSRLLSSGDADLHRLREKGRTFVRRCASQSFAERVCETIAAMLLSGMPEPASGGVRR